MEVEKKKRRKVYNNNSGAGGFKISDMRAYFPTGRRPTPSSFGKPG